MAVLYGPPLEKVTPYSIIIAFDLHKVLFHRDWRGIIKYLVKMPHKMKGFALLINPFFWITVYNIWKQTSVGDDIYERLVVRYPRFAAFKDDFIVLENMQKPDEEIVRIIFNLKAQGYGLYILSNIGDRTFIELAKKNNHFIHLFDHCFLPKKENGYEQKPSAPFYHDFLAFADKKGDGDKAILFIDDRVANLAGAAKVGISGLLCTDTEDLKKSLEHIGLLKSFF